jgi:rod shape determining protein RodA
VTIEAVDPRPRSLRNASRESTPGAFGLLARFDWILLGATLLLLAYGLWVINGITSHNPGGSAASRQGLYAAAGLIVLAAASLIDPSRYRRFSRLVYIALCGVMAAVLVFGAATNGSTRWINLGFFTFQPSEFGKVVLALFLAGFLSDRSKDIARFGVAVKAIACAVVTVVLVLAQPDVGTALVYVSVLAAALFVSGVRWRHLAVIGTVTLVGLMAVLWWLPAGGINVLKPYQTARLTGFTHPSANPNNPTSYSLDQSMIAVGSGGLEGRGVTGATQTLLDYLPNDDTDFAFASLSEQRGFFGASLLLLLYLLVVWRGLKVVTGSRDLFCAILAGGIVVGFLFQVFVNVGMTIGIAPITGIPLPFVSVGGSSMISNLAGIGILQAIAARGGRRRAWA